MAAAIAEQTRSEGARAGAAELAREPRITSHRVLEKLDRHHRGLEILHRDLFDGDQAVVLSALSAVAALADKRSLRLVVKLAATADKVIRAAAAGALGSMGHPEAAKVLLDLFRLSRDTAVRQAALSSLAAISPGCEQVRDLLRHEATSQMVASELRATAAQLLVRIGDVEAVSSLLPKAGERVLEEICAGVDGGSSAAPLVIAHGLQSWGSLSPEVRVRLLQLAPLPAAEGSSRMVLQALEDSSDKVRQAAYQAIGHSGQRQAVSTFVSVLADRVDPSPILEDEALGAIERLERLTEPPAGGPLADGGTLVAHIQELYRGINTTERQVASESHELGWMIARAREYLEYYADEGLRRGVVGFLKGSANYSADEMLETLKRSAVRVEVRHFEGYTALADLFKNPRRSGLGLIARELAIAKLGRRTTLYRLIRCLRLSRLFSPAALKVDPTGLYESIFEWAHEARLFRLAEAALYALAKVSRERATGLCLRCLKLPIASKICAIAAIRLLRELDRAVLEPSVVELLTPAGDPYVLLNLFDSLASSETAVSTAIVKGTLALVRSLDNQEVLQQAAAFLARQSSTPELQEGLSSAYDSSPAWKRGLILAILERWAAESRVADRDGLVETFYRLLRLPETGANRARVAALLWRLGDDYAPTVLAEIAAGDAAEQLQAVRSLKGAVTAELAPFVRALLPLSRVGLQDALAETLTSATDQDARDRMCDLVLALRGEAGSAPGPEEGAGELRVELSGEKKSFRFEREHVQELAVLFSDIQGYSKKAQALSAMELAALLQEYEGILLPTVDAHRGELIKKMGDGHLFVFASALDAALAGVRIQKALKRFNGYREERMRVMVRIGIHWGKVVRRDGDVLGNHVNIASRLESSCTGGSVLISEAVNQRLEAHIHTRDLGMIEVKNIAEPIRVYEPYEVALELPEEKDPLRSAQPEAPREAAAGAPDESRGRGRTGLDRRSLAFVVETFSHLNNLLQKAERDEIPVADVRRELARRWSQLRAALVGTRVR